MGSYRFGKHFLGHDNVPAFYGNDDGEKFRCAQALGSLSEVKFWARNVARHTNAFRLPIAGGWTYPDFVAQFNDGRLLVVEYKGEQLIAGATAKRAIGELWQAAGGGRGIYVMAQKLLDGLAVKAQLQAAIGTGVR